ncbi:MULTISPECIES: transcription-repair coupling factor [Eubacteriales]|uniref:Transcription-repair-coupling factor n=1 Tax=Bittarella massiliensis (ex Durand et al. 2017) TaxID=1720313 RepID=A0AAQ1RWL5_9FIRM|nr:MULTISPECIES: transcription-repair coupling factor [Eubacteriales]ERI98602.1 transcription-repair coupling factor [Clostridium sp. ATCC 29733]MZL70454.1 transcription-repair coupling factor [Bittarella massiliensis (ex Durand et al. 2017)]MZL80313.1 transcription-repair coupling factor [Bittarella massiliensis (ex Durand et al. 2017)]SHG33918.1 transcription-repair coupling factor [Bittarella massiliensis (ex Durand et al. 2017)]
MEFFTRIWQGVPAFETLRRSLEEGRVPLACYGLSTVHKANLIAALYAETGRQMLVLVPDERAGERMVRNLNTMIGGEAAALYRQKDYVFHPVEGASREFEYGRLSVLGRVLDGSCPIAVATAPAACQYTLPPQRYREATFVLRPGDACPTDQLARRLVEAGYVRRPQVDGPGQFSVRGGIVDLYPPQAAAPLRLEFWGDEVDTIAAFDLLTQRRGDGVEAVEITPAREVLVADPAALAAKLRKLGKNGPEALLADAERLETGAEVAGLDRYLSLCLPERATLFDYLEDAFVFTSELQEMTQELEGFLWQLGEDVKELLEQKLLSGKAAAFADEKGAFLARLGKGRTAFLETFSRQLEFPLKELLDFTAVSTASWSGQMNLLLEELASQQEQNYCTLVLAGTEKAAKTLAYDLQKDGYNAQYTDSGKTLSPKKVYVAAGSLTAGFEYPELRVGVISYTLQEGKGKRRTAKKKRGKDAITTLEDVTPGDYVVHVTHGIGQFTGITQLDLQGVKKDYLKIQYAGKDVLFVPVTQLDLVSKYIGPREDRKIKLNKLHSTEWQRTKQRVYSSVKDMADELIKLYAERAAAKGFAFSEDSEWQREFEERFEYTETDDQLRCIEEIKADMQSPRPMDRVLCGDVGYGKTEVALRAAFKCVLDSKQCAILVPTTILAWQHYQTILKRMGNFPVNVELLSRFRTPAQQAESIRRLRSGQADIVVGTHRLLQKDVRFKDLGLVVIDEEQRFGVAHKEKFKEAFKGIDVLTLSATPIPRTLNMAMSGIRDISIIDEPPQDRHPIQTYVLEHSDLVVGDAIRKELRRGGQVYYLYNRVESIEACASRVRQMAPDANVAVAHGKMGERELSSVWAQLLEGSIDVLVCTTIIETGVDVANCNTLIIEDADRLGLSQLYQIRGRVGRSAKRAFAYFTFKRGKALSEVASKRLTAIREFTSFGSGFKIAMRDLEIRGAGNILGAQQHGHMEAVGYDMYLRLLSEAVSEKKGEEKPYKNEECLVDIQLDAYIPKAYIEDMASRIDTYKKIAAIQSREEADDLLDELIDRFSDPPAPVVGLVDVALLRNQAANLGVGEITQREDTVYIRFVHLEMERVARAVGCKKGVKNVLFNAGEKPFLAAVLENPHRPIDGIRAVLDAMSDA